jgi:hypothetical protein
MVGLSSKLMLLCAEPEQSLRRHVHKMAGGR